MAISLDDAREFKAMPSLMERIYGKPRHRVRRVLGWCLGIGASLIAVSVLAYPLGH